MITLIIIAITIVTSIIGFKERHLFNRFLLSPHHVYHRREIHRLLTHGFLHSDYTHLIFNMITLSFFGGSVENTLHSTEQFLLLYCGGIVISSTKSIYTHRNNYSYNGVGASGGVSSIVFASILFNPWASIYFFLIPIPIPAVIYGCLYLGYSHYMSKQNIDNINHDAHFIGSIFGFVLPILVNPSYLSQFFYQIMHP